MITFRLAGKGSRTVGLVGVDGDGKAYAEAPAMPPSLEKAIEMATGDGKLVTDGKRSYWMFPLSSFRKMFPDPDMAATWDRLEAIILEGGRNV
jgi:hypothetical protein